MCFKRGILQAVAYVVIVTYCSVFGIGTAVAAETSTSTPVWQLIAQASMNPAAAGGRISAEEQQALRQIYDEKIQRLEAEMNSTRGTRNTLLTVAVTSAFLGAGIMAGSSTVSSAIEGIDVKDEQEEQSKEDALQAIDALQGIGGGILGAGGVALLGYLIYSGVISSKQGKIDTLRDELDSRFAVRGLTPDYLQKNESVAAVLEEIADVKKSAGTARSFQGFFSRIAIGSLLSGAFLYAVSSAGQNVIDEVEIDESDPDEVQSREDARDEAKNIETTGLILLGAGGVCALSSLFFARRAASKENAIDSLENSLLRVAGRIDFQPKYNGFALLYSHAF